MILIYSSIVSNRLNYILDLIFSEMIKVDYKFTNDNESFKSYEGAKINYSANYELGGLIIKPTKLLFEKDIKEQNIIFDDWNGIPVFFHHPFESYIPFDLFAASFFLVSRYEEYLPFTADEHNRFPAHQSILYKNRVLQFPLINAWVHQLRKALQTLYGGEYGKALPFEYVPSIDIDMAFQYLHKGYFRNLVGKWRDYMNGETDRFYLRKSVLKKKIADPFNNFEYQNKIHEKYNQKVNYFFLLGNRSKYDKNTYWRNKHFQEIIKNINSNALYTLGIHPSYKSNKNPNLILKEKQRLEETIGRSIQSSRQHYLMLQFPQTYNRLIDLGIKHDYSLGYSNEIGFRAGIAHPFFFYDLKNDRSTDLMLHPFCSMDITPQYYYKMTPNEAIEMNRELMNKVKKYGGKMMSLWHNESLSDSLQWTGWRAVYEDLIITSLA